MKACLICRKIRLAPGFTTVRLTQEEINITITGVPATICSSCGETYVDDGVARRLFQLADKSMNAGRMSENLYYSIDD
jgi:YgiT-type zinc finger domain-containing protein